VRVIEGEVGGTLRRRIGIIIGPNGEVLTRDNLPPAGTKRWVSTRKAEIVAAVEGGLISLEEACQRYAISNEEFMTWRRAYKRHGHKGLRATKTGRG
jgi:transposase-like protein